jgi:hypothetical protein
MYFRWVVFGLLIALSVGMIFCMECGYRAGMRRAGNEPGWDRSGVGAIEGAILGLLTLVIAFSYSEAGSRFEYRRQLVVEEANAIGTAYLRVDLLPAGEQPAIRRLFRDYLDARIGAVDKLPDVAAAEAEAARSEAIGRQIWALALEGSKGEDRRTAALLLTPSLNSMIDIGNESFYAAKRHAPGLIFALIAGLALLGAAVAGYGLAGGRERPVMLMAAFIAAVVLAVYVIVDLEYPRIFGFIRIQSVDEALISLRALM